MATVGNPQLIAKNSIYLYFRLFFILCVKLFTTRVIVNSLGFEDFGIYNVVASVVIFCSFVTAALNNSTNRYIAYEIGAGNEESINRVYTMAIKCHLILAVSLFIVIGTVGFWFVNNHLEISPSRLVAANWLFLFSLLNLVFSIIQVPFNACIIANEHMNFYALLGVVEVLCQLGIAYLLTVSNGDKLILYGALLMTLNYLVMFANRIYCKLRFRTIKFIRGYWEKSMVKQFASYSGWSLLVNAADATSEQSISIFFNWFIGVVGNAALAINNQVNSALHYFTNGVLAAVKPQIIKSYASGEKKYFMRLIFSSSKISYLVLLMVIVPLVLNIEFILSLWLGDYPEAVPSYIKVTVVFYLFDISQMPFVYAVHATGKLKTHQIVVGSFKISAIPLTYLTLRLGYGGTGALLVWTVLNILCAIFRTIYMHKLIGMDILEYICKVLLPVLIFTILLFPIPLLLSKYLVGWACLLSTTGLSFILSALLCYFVVLDSSEKAILKKLPVVNKILK